MSGSGIAALTGTEIEAISLIRTVATRPDELFTDFSDWPLGEISGDTTDTGQQFQVTSGISVINSPKDGTKVIQNASTRYVTLASALGSSTNPIVHMWCRWRFVQNGGSNRSSGLVLMPTDTSGLTTADSGSHIYFAYDRMHLQTLTATANVASIPSGSPVLYTDNGEGWREVEIALYDGWCVIKDHTGATSSYTHSKIEGDQRNFPVFEPEMAASAWTVEVNQLSASSLDYVQSSPNYAAYIDSLFTAEGLDGPGFVGDGTVDVVAVSLGDVDLWPPPPPTGTPPTIVAAGKIQDASQAVTAHNISLFQVSGGTVTGTPFTCQAGDLILFAMYNDDTATLPVVNSDYTTPTNGSGVGMRVQYKTAAGGEGSTGNASAATGADLGMAIVLRGATGIGDVQLSNGLGQAMSVDALTLTENDGSSTVVAFGGRRANNNTFTASTNGTSLTLLLNNAPPSGSGVVGIGAIFVDEGAASFTGGNITGSDGGSTSWTFIAVEVLGTPA